GGPLWVGAVGDVGARRSGRRTRAGGIAVGHRQEADRGMLGRKARAQRADAAGADDGDADIVLLHCEALPSARAYATCRTGTSRRKRRRCSSSTSIPSPGRSETSTCPRAIRSGCAVTSSASPALVSVRPHAICGSTAAVWVAAARAHVVWSEWVV